MSLPEDVASGAKRKRPQDEGEGHYGRNHYGDSKSGREPTYYTSQPAPSALMIIDNAKRIGGTAMRFSQEIGEIANPGRIRLESVICNKVFKTVNRWNKTLIHDQTTLGVTTTIVIELLEGVYSAEEYVTEFNSRAVVELSSLRLTAFELGSTQATPGTSGRPVFSLSNIGTPAVTIVLKTCDFFRYGHSVHGLGVYNNSTRSYGPPLGDFVVHSGEPAGLVPSNYYTISSRAITQATKIRSPGDAPSAIGIIPVTSNEQAVYNFKTFSAGAPTYAYANDHSKGSNFSFELEKVHVENAISCTLNQPPPRVIDIELVDQNGKTAEPVATESTLILFFSIKHHYT